MWTSFYFLSVSRRIRYRCYGNSTWSLYPGKNAGLKSAFSILVLKIRRLRTSFLFILAERKEFQPEVKLITAMRSVSGKSDIRKFCTTRENDSTFNIYIYIIYMYTYLFFISLHIITLRLTFQCITLLFSFYFSITNHFHYKFYFRRSYSCISHSIFYLQTQMHVERAHKVAINIQKDVTKRRETSAKERPTIAQIKLRIRHAYQSICPSASSPECNKTRIPLFERPIS